MYVLTYLGIACLALLLGFGPISHDTKTAWFHASGFYFVLIAVLIWFLSFFYKRSYTDLWLQIKNHLPAFFFSCVMIFAILTISSFQWRILYDESNLLGVSQTMFEHNTFYIPIQALFQNDQFVVIDREWGIRPLVFPCLLFLFTFSKDIV